MKEIFKLSLVLMIIAAVSAGVLAFVSNKTAEPIKESLKQERLEAVSSVLPTYDNEPDQDTVAVRSDGGKYLFYRGRKGEDITGVAFAVVAPNGYSGEIEIMVGVDTTGVITGIEILKHLETPGLGAKIETSEFREQFKGMGPSSKWDVKKDGGDVKQITGATISSRAVTHAICRGIEFFMKNKQVILSSSGSAAPKEE